MGKGGWLLAVLALSGCLAGQPTAAPSPAGCRLPISIGATGQAQGAFVEYPSGKVSIDPYGGRRGYNSRFPKWLPRNTVVKTPPPPRGDPPPSPPAPHGNPPRPIRKT